MTITHFWMLLQISSQYLWKTDILNTGSPKREQMAQSLSSTSTFTFILIQLQHTILSLLMNHHKSIAKTRNELDRISYKIGQLKEKHTLVQPHNYHRTQPNAWVHKQTHIEHMRDNSYSKRLRPDSYTKEVKSTVLGEDQRRDIKSLKLELVQYIDKLVVANERREKQLMKNMKNSRANVDMSSIEQKIQKLHRNQSQIQKRLVENSEDIGRIKESESMFMTKMENAQEKLNESIQNNYHIYSKLQTLQTNNHNMQFILAQFKENQGKQYSNVQSIQTRVSSIQNGIHTHMNNNNTNRQVQDKLCTLTQQIQQIKHNLLSTQSQYKIAQAQSRQGIREQISKLKQLQFNNQQQIHHMCHSLSQNYNYNHIQTLKQSIINLQNGINHIHSQQQQYSSLFSQIKDNHLQEIQHKYELISSTIQSKVQSLYSHISNTLSNHQKEYENVIKNIDAHNKEMYRSQSKQTIQENTSSDAFDRRLEEFQHNLNTSIKNLYDQFQYKLSEIKPHHEHQQLSLHLQKLQNNFNYVHERMSKIQYDNAYFKDRLTLQQKVSSPSKSIFLTPQKSLTPEKSNSSGMLHALQQFNAKGFFDEEI